MTNRPLRFKIEARKESDARMKIRVPDYFVDFRCIADRCKDSCCIGWEIDIDDDARRKYEALDTPLGREIREKTSHGFFTLQENGRCAFLDEGGLCRIISSVGEGYLCDICREHPRYYGVGGKGIEGGLGLSCEEAARIILSLRKLPRIIEIERDVPYLDEDEFAPMSNRIREKLYKSIFRSSTYELVDIYKAYALIADRVGIRANIDFSNHNIPKITYIPISQSEIREFYERFTNLLYECESLDRNWAFLINKIRLVNVDDILKKEQSFRSLLYYFTHRYVREGIIDMTLGERILFALGSTFAILAFAEVLSGDDKETRASVLYSKNIEYSTDNVDMILDELSNFL